MKQINKISIKGLALLLGVFLLLSLGAGTTIAWLETESETLTNVFDKSDVPPEIEEEFDGETKENVKVRNTGNIDAFIRVALTAVWLDDDGNVAPDAVDPIALTLNSSWFLHDGFYYHKGRVAPDATTANLIDSFVLPLKDGLRYELQVIASTIQADPDDAVLDAWGIEVGTDGRLAEPVGP